MKKSNYNVFFPKSNCVLSYNTFTDNYVLVSHEVYNTFEKEDIETLSSKFPSAFESFKQSGFIIDDERDELGTIRLANRKQTFASRNYFLMIYPTQDCNLKCWYCYENHVQNTCISEEVINATIKHIVNKIESKEIDSLHLTFFGGEPLLFFDTTVYPLLKQVNELCKISGISFYPFFVTNGSLITEEVVMKLKPFNPIFQITLDGNRQKHDKVRIGKSNNYPTFDKIISALQLISDNISSKYSYVPRIITVRINYDNQTLKYTDEIIDALSNLDRSKVSIHLERVWQTKNSVNEEQRQQLKQTILKFSNAGFKVGHGIFGLRSVSCPAEEYNYAVINYNGLVYKCNGRNLTPNTAEGKLLPDGTIKWNEIDLIKRLSKPTFENERCINCVMLPQCMGPCSQKQIEKGWGNINEICSLNIIDTSLEDYLTLDFEVRYTLQQFQ
ncbi:radical SAM/SPASM domain-containing protein [Proteiniphilum sp. X52]|uniref:radical SAM/SPASM domain-containing protein n=1 Tax=Proteiniphilum sp. X52 TaxID=2382159 RepID=UPI000F0A2C2B|nr:radical SAM protein [Proteiniphilum sp. X52]RNC63277.1 radical SAM protein [Proteiniphilum sp. X52]